MTPLAEAFAAMEARPDDDGARLTYYLALADTDLSLVLNRDSDGETADARTMTVDGVETAMAFDDDLTLVDTCGPGTEFLAASGRQIAALLAPAGVGLAVNPGAADTAVLPPEALAWLTQTLAQSPEAAAATPVAVHPPTGIPEVVESALSRRLTGLPGLARAGWLVAFDYGDGSRGHALVIEGATARVEDALAAALSEALVFSGVDAGVLDITFPAEDAPLWPAIQRQGRRLAFPAAAVPQPPGSNPDAPPKLR